jgi:hypothetical protein
VIVALLIQRPTGQGDTHMEFDVYSLARIQCEVLAMSAVSGTQHSTLIRGGYFPTWKLEK